jgi:hypothetical protein
MRTATWAVVLLALGALGGTAFGSHPQEASSYITAGPVVQGIPQLPENWAILSYNGFVFDTRVGEPALPAGLRIESYPKGTAGYYLVTFQVPITEAVRQEVAFAGAKFLYYMPYNSFLVAMDEAAKARMESSPAVSWVGIFQPAYKVAYWFEGLSGTRDVWVQLFQQEDINLVANKLRGMGLGSVSIDADGMFKIMKVRMDVGSVGRIAALREVAWIEPWPEYKLVNALAQWTTQTFFPGFRRLWDKGIDGTGETVSTGDSGIQPLNRFFWDPAGGNPTTWGDFPTHRKIIAYKQGSSMAVFNDGSGASWHGTHTAGTICGDDAPPGGIDPNDGMPLKAKMYFIDIGDNTSNSVYPPADMYNVMYGQAYTGNAGGAARISSQSWGGGTTYNSNSAQTDQFMFDKQDMLVFISAGNSGPGGGTIGAPGTAKDIVTAGACGDGFAGTSLAGFSSRGPSPLNRRKPTIVGPGVGLMSAYGGANIGVRQMSGTSMASPCLAGTGALVRGYFRKGFYPTGDSVPANRWSYVSAALVKAVMVNSAMNDMQGYTIPDNNVGWGRVCLDNTLYFAGEGRKLTVWDDTTGLNTGGFRDFTVNVNTDAEPLKITMVFTDYPGAAGAPDPTVNKMDLRVTAPGGTQYLGNVFSGGWSTTGGTADANNTEECVYIRQPALGQWTVRVTGTDVAQRGIHPGQSYALVVSGGLGTAGAQVLSLRKNVVIDNYVGSNGNNNGRVDIGETVGFVDTIYNGGGAAVNGVVATLRCADPLVMFNRGDTIANLGNMSVGATANNGAAPFKLVVRGIPRFVTFTLHLVGTFANDMPYTEDISFPVRVGIADNEAIGGWTPRVRADSSMIYGLAYDGANLWASEWINGRIYKLSTTTLDTVPGGFQGPTATQLTDLAWDWGDNLLWVHSQNTHIVYKVRTTNGAIVRQFASRATAYAIGLALRGDWTGGRRDTIWEGDRGVALTDPKIMYKCDSLGNLVQSFTLAGALAAPYGLRCLAAEPRGIPYQLGGTLLSVITDFSAPGPDLLAAHVYEIRQSGAAVDTVPSAGTYHHFVCGWNLRGIERDSSDWNYWVTAFNNAALSNIYKIRGFYTKPLPPSGAELGPVALPTAFALGQSYPNPMVGGATIKYALPRDVPVSFKVYNVSGQLVKTLVSGTEKAGYKQVSWDGKSNGGHKVGAGVYFYRFQAGDFTATKKLVVVR